MNTDELLRKTLTSDELPTLPTVASKFIHLTSQKETTLADIAGLVSQDIALSSKILKVSNSEFYNFPQQISSIDQAVSILGANAVRSLVLSFSFLSLESSKDESKFDFQQFWEKSLASAVAAKLILEKVEGADTENIFIAGLLQNLGELVLAKTFPDKYNTKLQTVEGEVDENGNSRILISETNHSFVGAEVAKKWGFPELLIQPIQFHHQPDKCTSTDAKIQLTVDTVHLSDLLVNILYSSKPEKYHRQFSEESKKLLNLNSEDIESILEQMHSKIQEVGSYFDLKIKSSKSIQEILQEANIRLSLLNLDYDQINKQLVNAKIHLEQMTQELEEKNRILNNLANIDGLTGVYNHRYFQNALDQEISRSIRQKSYLSLLLIDIDHFKTFNDTYGHQTGDFILIEFAKKLQKHLRKYDILARYGGEEFAVILPETAGEEAVIVGEKLRKIIEKTSFANDHEKYHVTASFGQICNRPVSDSAFNKNTFISQADRALYMAKDKGRNCVVSYSPQAG
ncbi:MAG: GGDEF domain-containing protein [Deltaproteobacteria bacterium]|nr:GGDEF domain-containing protein [Deltaproteobacteria bacterium]